MKPNHMLVLFLAALSLVAGYLLSKASLVGRVGMSLFYQEYNFLKSWWKGGLPVFAVLMGLYALHGALGKRLVRHQARMFHIGMVVVALAGLYVTYYDFRHTLSHRLLGERFHIGAYLFWQGWIIISCYYLARAKSDTGTVAG